MLSKREKIMLLLLGILLCVFCGIRFGVMPLKMSISSNKAALESLEIRKMEIQNELTRYGNIEELLELEEEKIASNNFMFKNIDTVDVDKMLQKLASENQVTILSNNISKSKVTPVEEFKTEQDMLIYPLRNYAIGFDDVALSEYETQAYKNQNDEGETNEDYSVPFIRSEIKFDGNVDNVANFLDDIVKMGKSVVLQTIEGKVDNHIFEGNIILDIYFIH